MNVKIFLIRFKDWFQKHFSPKHYDDVISDELAREIIQMLLEVNKDENIITHRVKEKTKTDTNKSNSWVLMQ